MIQFVLWYLIITLLGWITFPITYRLFHRLPDRGYAFSRALGWLLWGYLFWLMVSLRTAQNDTGGVLLAGLVVAGVSIWLATRPGAWAEMRGWLRSRRSMLVTAELVFLAAFVVWAFVRSANPEIAGTEKPMEMAFIDAILKSPSFPPLDPWLSGYAISYYYFGYVLVTLLIRISGVSAGIAFNLAISLVFALTALGAYGLVYNLLKLWKPEREFSLTPIFAPFLILFSGNLEGILELIHARGWFWTQAADGSWTSPFWSWLGVLELTDPPNQPFSWVVSRAGTLYWRGSRVLADYNYAGTFQEVIDEFPFFSYYLADLHPHVLSMPFTLLAIGLALAVFLAPKEEGFTLLGWRVPVDRSTLFVSGLILGGLAFMNTWDFPIYIAVFCLALVFRRAVQQGWSWGLLQDFFYPAILLGILGVVLYLPFYLGFSSQAGGILPSLVFFTRGNQMWVMFGTFFSLLFVFLSIQAVKAFGWRDFLMACGAAAALGLVLLTQAYPLIAVILGALVFFSIRPGKKYVLIRGLLGSTVLILGLWALSYAFGAVGAVLKFHGQDLGTLFLDNQGFPMTPETNHALALNSVLSTATSRRLAAPGAWYTLWILFGLLFALIPAWTRRPASTSAVAEQDQLDIPDAPAAKNPSLLFVLALTLVGALLVLGPEFFYLRDMFGNRMNTIFKFYFEAWVLWSIAGASMIGFLLHSLRKAGRVFFSAGLVGLVLVGLAYPLVMFSNDPSHSLKRDHYTLDGTLYFSPDQRQALNFLRQAPLGTIAEAVSGSYGAGGMYSAFSGQPTVIGWPFHESQWRGSGDGLGQRQQDVETLYRTTDWNEAQTILARYNIRYVVVSSLERYTYPIHEEKFQMYLEPAFQAGDVTIYEVAQTTNALKGAP